MNITELIISTYNLEVVKLENKLELIINDNSICFEERQVTVDKLLGEINFIDQKRIRLESYLKTPDNNKSKTEENVDNNSTVK